MQANNSFHRNMKTAMRIILFLFLILHTCSIQAVNHITIKQMDTIALEKDSLNFQYWGINNQNEKTTITYRITSENHPFEIYKVELKVREKLYQPLEPFSMSVKADDIVGKKMVWEIQNEFTKLTGFSYKDVILVHSDKGIIEISTSVVKNLIKQMDNQKETYEKQIEQKEEESQQAWRILSGVMVVVLLSALSAYWFMRIRLRQRREEMETMTMLIAERTEKNEKLQSMVDSLYSERLDTLNMLCNEYFEKNESERIKLTLFNEVEKHIMALRDRKNVEALEKVVNTYLNNILIKLREQLPTLSQSDMTFITYLYAGFSPRAICIFTDIKVKNFYNKRSRLKEKILASGAPDKAWFVSKM